MKIGLYFGSFNPIHIGHLIIGNHIAAYTELEQVWFVVSPQNPLKKSSSLLNEYHRLHLVQLAVEDSANLKASNIEFKLPRPSYTINTLTYLSEKYPDNFFTVIMGSDSYQNLPKWKNYEQLLNNYSILVYKRPGFEVAITHENVNIINAPLLEISSTSIRAAIKEGKSIKYLLPEAVKDEIERTGYYKSVNL